MACTLENREEMLIDYVDGSLPADRLAQMMSHMKGCAECRVAADAQLRVWTALEEWTPAPVSADFNRTLYQKIDVEQSKGWWQRLAWPPLGLAAACMVLVVAMLFRVPGGPVNEPEKKADVTIDVNQVDRTLEDIEMFKQLGVGNDVNEAEGVL